MSRTIYHSTSIRLTTAMCSMISLSLVSMSSAAGKGATKDLHVMVMLPFSGSWRGGESILAAVDIGLQQVNDQQVVPGYRLVRGNYTDTKCDSGWALKGLYDNIVTPPTKVVILGAGCSPVSEVLGQVAQHFNLVQVSPVSVSPALSDKRLFPLFARLTSPDTMTNPARLRIFQKFGWSRIATIHQSHEVFSKTTEDLIRKMRAAGLKVVQSEAFSDDPSTQIRNLKDNDCRVIVGAFYEDAGRKVLCEAYKQGVFGRRVVWVLTGWFDDGWWRAEDTSIDCTAQQMEQAAEGYFDVDTVYLNPREERAVSGLLPSQWLETYLAAVSGKSLKNEQNAPQGTDAVWAIALALNATKQRLGDAGDRKTLEDFSYTDREMSSLIYDSLLNLSFVGVSGQVSFDGNGDFLGSFRLDRVQGGTKQTVGWYYPNDGGQLMWSTEHPIIWEGGVIPRDGTVKRTEYVPLSRPLYVTMCVLASLGILLACGFLAFNVLLRNVKLVKMSSPRLNNVILVGCIVCYTSVFVDESGTIYVSLGCQLKNGLMCVGMALAFGALFAKTWRVYLIFTNAKIERKILTDVHLLSMVGVLVLLNVVVIVIWTLVDPGSLEVDLAKCSFTTELDEAGEVEVWRCERSCRWKHKLYFLGTLYAIHALVLLFGTFLAYETRHVHYRELNDSKYIGMCVYLISVLTIPSAILTLGLDPGEGVQYGVRSSLIILGTTVSQCIIFLPKIQAYRRYRDHGPEGSSRTHSVQGASRNPSLSSLSDVPRGHGGSPASIPRGRPSHVSGPFDKPRGCRGQANLVSRPPTVLDAQSNLPL